MMHIAWGKMLSEANIFLHYDADFLSDGVDVLPAAVPWIGAAPRAYSHNRVY